MTPPLDDAGGAINQELAAALHALVRSADAAKQGPGDRQAARRAIEATTVVAEIARRESFGAA